MKQFLSNELIYEVINSSNVLHKSIISFMFTTGLRHDKLRDFKIKDLLNACGRFNTNGKSITDFLDKNPFNLIPCWKISEDTRCGICFNTPETTRYLFDYLKDRNKYVILTEDSYLFNNYDKNKTSSVDEKPLDKNFITKELHRKKSDLNKSRGGDEIQLNAESISYTFAKICEKHLSIADSDKEELIALFQVNTTKENKFYPNYDVKKYYLELMQYLTINPAYLNFHCPVSDNNDVRKNDNDDSELDIKQKINLYYMDNIKKERQIDYDEYWRLTGIVYDLVRFYKNSKHHTFIVNEDSLSILFKKAKVSALIDDYKGKICVDVNEDNIDVKIDEIKHLINDIGILYVVHIDDNHLNNVLKGYLNYNIHDNYGRLIITSSAIQEIIYLCIDGFFVC